MPADTRATHEETSDVRTQATETVESVVQHARPPLLAALGAGDLAAQTMRDAFAKVRSELNERAETARQDLPNDLNELREKLDPAELRRLVDAYTESARQLYGYLTDRGEQALDRLQAEPRVRQVRERVETAQGKIDDAVGEVRELADDVLGTVSTSGTTDSAESAEAPEGTGEPARNHKTGNSEGPSAEKSAKSASRGSGKRSPSAAKRSEQDSGAEG